MTDEEYDYLQAYLISRGFTEVTESCDELPEPYKKYFRCWHKPYENLLMAYKYDDDSIVAVFYTDQNNCIYLYFYGIDEGFVVQQRFKLFRTADKLISFLED